MERLQAEDGIREIPSIALDSLWHKDQVATFSYVFQKPRRENISKVVQANHRTGIEKLSSHSKQQ